MSEPIRWTEFGIPDQDRRLNLVVGQVGGDPEPPGAVCSACGRYWARVEIVEAPAPSPDQPRSLTRAATRHSLLA